ncbi:DUF1456 family protein [Cobetia amphilecti]|nr:DUF1456 family protein [Cobetia litoralis]
MTNNDIIRRLRYALNLSDTDMINTFAAADHEVSRAQISDWLKRDDDEAQQRIKDIDLARFLNGLINVRRGKREGAQPAPEKRLDNNVILRKLKIAFELKDDDMLELLALAGFELITKSELSAFFRKPDHRHYRECKDQILRNLLKGIELRHRRDDPETEQHAVDPV